MKPAFDRRLAEILDAYVNHARVMPDAWALRLTALEYTARGKLLSESEYTFLRDCGHHLSPATKFVNRPVGPQLPPRDFEL